MVALGFLLVYMNDRKMFKDYGKDETQTWKTAPTRLQGLKKMFKPVGENYIRSRSKKITTRDKQVKYQRA